jgi:antitoxin ParD1/3/4
MLVHDKITQEATMARNTSVTIGDHFTGFISEQVQTGRYGSTSDVVRAGLRLLEEHEAKVKALQEALLTGEQSGEPQPFDSEAFLDRMHAKHAARNAG